MQRQLYDDRSGGGHVASGLQASYTHLWAPLHLLRPARIRYLCLFCFYVVVLYLSMCILFVLIFSGFGFSLCIGMDDVCGFCAGN